jgi:Ca2+-transporting ATPase
LLGTAPLTFDEWLAVLGWSLVLPIVIELYKAVRRKQAAAPADSTNLHNILPDRVLSPGDHR